MPSPRQIFLAILALGAYAQILQAMLVREALVVFYGNEISLGAFYASWLFWIGIGSVMAVYRDPLSGRPRVPSPDPLPLVRRLLLALPLILLVQILALRTVRLALDVSASELVPLGDLFLALFLATAPSGLVLGLAFPLSCRALELATAGTAARLAGRLYIADALGALAGGLVFTWVLIPRLGVVESLGALTSIVGLILWSLRGRLRRPGAFALALLAAGVGLAVSPGTERLDRALERLRFATLQPGLTLVDATSTRYGHIAIASLGDQRSVVEDGQIGQSFPLPREVASDAALVYSEADGPTRVLVLGGFAGGLPAELLRYPIERLDQLEQDPAALDLVAPHLAEGSIAALRDPRLRLIHADGRGFVRDLPPDARYGLVVVFAPSPTNAAGNRFFTQDFYDEVRRHLGPAGVLCTRVGAASSYVGREVGGYAGSVYHTLKSRFDTVVLVPGDPATFCASSARGPVTEDPETLAARYRALGLEDPTFPADGFRSLLPPDDVDYLRERLEQVPIEINRDDRPVTYYLNTVLWGELSASGVVGWMKQLRALGPWPYLLPAVVFLLLWLLRSSMEAWPRPARLRQGAGIALFALGLVAMAAGLMLLLGIQAQVGFLFERIALLNGLLMTGLALGAGAGARLAGRGRDLTALLAVLLAVAIGVSLLPSALSLVADLGARAQEACYLGLALLVGLVAGAGFPLGVALAHPDLRSTPGSAGLMLAADSFGGALGGLITGALMVPLLGVADTARILAALSLAAAVPLLHARFGPDRIQWLAARGLPSLPRPWPGLGWILCFLVLVVLGWHWLERSTAPGPPVRFDQARLAALAGPGHYRSVDHPFVHYLGTQADPGEHPDPGPAQAASPGPGPAAAPDTAVAASHAAAPEVRGFAGPLNLLVALDPEGRLLGVRYLGSRETPSYVADIQAWLAGLKGRDLSEGPLSLAGVDGLSGATVTSRAALETINRTAARLSLAAFEHETPKLDPRAPPLDARFWTTLALLLAAIPIYLSGSERARLGLLAATLAVLGVWLNTPVTEVDLANLLQGHAAAPAENPQRWLLWGFIAITCLLFGQLWCGYLCPFGALQELVGRLGRRLGLRRYADRRLDARLRSLKLVLLAAMLLAVLATGDGTWAGIDPMQQVFGGQLDGWMWGLTITVLAGALVYVRFWCRYLCPLGAFLALSNKIALLQHLAPKRRFEHCDLGVRQVFDIDCIRCNRCLSGRDTRLHSGTAAAGEHMSRHRGAPHHKAI